mmetsp:Transcript_72880/g.236800  ORF Transcript_72880/g.236800 Transcript_72880/m.236800 type:complete len:422 (+) Transcript_72880:230-1495(+)
MQQLFFRRLWHVRHIGNLHQTPFPAGPDHHRRHAHVLRRCDPRIAHGPLQQAADARPMQNEGHRLAGIRGRQVEQSGLDALHNLGRRLRLSLRWQFYLRNPRVDNARKLFSELCRVATLHHSEVALPQPILHLKLDADLVGDDAPGLAGALQRRGPDRRQALVLERLRDHDGLFATQAVQRHVDHALKSSVQVPIRLTMPAQQDRRRSHVLSPLVGVGVLEKNPSLATLANAPHTRLAPRARPALDPPTRRRCLPCPQPSAKRSATLPHGLRWRPTSQDTWRRARTMQTPPDRSQHYLAPLLHLWGMAFEFSRQPMPSGASPGPRRRCNPASRLTLSPASDCPHTAPRSKTPRSPRRCFGRGSRARTRRQQSDAASRYRRSAEPVFRLLRSAVCRYGPETASPSSNRSRRADRRIQWWVRE